MMSTIFYNTTKKLIVKNKNKLISITRSNFFINEGVDPVFFVIMRFPLKCKTRFLF